MEEWLINLSTDHTIISYIIIILISAAEGPILSMVLGVLIKLGYFSFFPVYIALMVGDLIADSILYYLGYHYGHSVVKKFGKYISIQDEHVDKASKIFHKYKHTILIISKMTNGFGLSLAVLVTAGIAKIPFWKFILSNFIGQFVWSGLLIGVGYYFSHLYLQINSVLGKVFLVVSFIVFFLIFHGFIKYVRSKSKAL